MAFLLCSTPVLPSCTAGPGGASPAGASTSAMKLLWPQLLTVACKNVPWEAARNMELSVLSKWTRAGTPITHSKELRQAEKPDPVRFHAQSALCFLEHPLWGGLHWAGVVGIGSSAANTHSPTRSWCPSLVMWVTPWHTGSPQQTLRYYTVGGRCW